MFNFTLALLPAMVVGIFYHLPHKTHVNSLVIKANQSREYRERHRFGKDNGSDKIFTNPKYRDLMILSDHATH